MTIPDHDQSVQAQFGNVADHYRTSIVHAKGADLDTMLNCVVLDGTERLLDAGSGAGHTALAFASRVREVVAYDLTPAMLEQVERLAAERGLTNISTMRGNVEELPFEDGEFDLVVSRYSAHHWTHPERALRELRRVLKLGGWFILSDVVAFSDHTQDTFLQTIELLRDPSHVRDHSVPQWQAMFEDSGFTSEIVLRFDVPLDFNDWVRRMATPPDQVSIIKKLWAGAPAEVQAKFQLQPGWYGADNFEFVIPGAVVRGKTVR